MKRVLILGAGLMQGRAITAAKQKGWHVTAIDGNPAAPCAKEADAFFVLDLKEAERIADFALSLKKSEGLDGVFTCATDFSYSVALAAERCDLPSHSVKAAFAASNKAEMRRLFAEAGVPSPAFAVITAENAPRALEEARAAGVGFPAVVKPCDNMGARGCKKVSSPDELKAALVAAMRFSRSGTVIIEEYLEGPEFSVEALVFDGEFCEAGFADRHIFFPPYFIEMGHTMPSALPDEEKERVLEAFKAGARALGLSYGAVKGDIKLTAKGPAIGEIAGRLSGGFLSGWTYPYSSGVELTSAALDLCVGIRPKALKPLFERVAAERAWISVPGKIAAISGLESAKSAPLVRDVFLLKKEGERVVFPQNNVEKCGNCIAVSSDAALGNIALSREEATRAAEGACRAIVLRLAPHESETERFLFGFDEAGEECAPSGEAFPPACFALPFKEAAGGSLPSVFAGGWTAATLELAGGRESSAKSSIIKEESCEDSLEIALPVNLPFFDEECRDWQGRTMREAFLQAALEEREILDDLRPQKGGEALAARYWTAFLRGGLQGLLYAHDSR